MAGGERLSELDLGIIPASVPADGTPPKDSTADDPLSHRFEYMGWAPAIRALYDKLIDNAFEAKVPAIAYALNQATSAEIPFEKRLAEYKNRMQLPVGQKMRNSNEVLEFADALALVHTGELLKETPRDEKITVTLSQGSSKPRLHEEITLMKKLMGADPGWAPRSTIPFPLASMPEFGLQVEFGLKPVAGSNEFLATAKISRLPKDRRAPAPVGRRG